MSVFDTLTFDFQFWSLSGIMIFPDPYHIIHIIESASYLSSAHFAKEDPSRSSNRGCPEAPHLVPFAGQRDQVQVDFQRHNSPWPKRRHERESMAERG